MPLYDLKCQNCSHVFEVRAKIGAADAPCVKCQGPTKKTILVAPRMKTQSGWAAGLAEARRKTGNGN